MILSGGPHVLGPQRETRRCLIPSLQSLSPFPFYGMFLIYVKCETRTKSHYLTAVSSQPQPQRRSLLLTARPWEKRHGRLHPEAQTATLRPFPSLLLASFSPSLSLIGYSLFISLTFLDLLNCREWRMDVPFKDVVFDTADAHGSALSLRPLLFPDRKIDEMRVSALTQGTTNGVSIASYRPVLYQVHGTFSLKSKLGSFTRLPSMQARQRQC